MIYLMSGAGAKVHFVFTSDYLMRRDQQEATDILSTLIMQIIKSSIT
jgi:preprotein translocase subunit SecA